MKILILTEGGKGIGFGHAVRCSALCRAFRDEGAEAKLIVNGDDSIRSLLTGTSYKIFDWIKEKNDLLEMVGDAGILIIDSYLAIPRLYEKLAGLVALSVFIDDNKRIDYPNGIVVNGNIYADNLKYRKRDGVTYLLGPKYALLRSDFWKMTPKYIKNDIENVAVTFGGNDSYGLTLKILELLIGKYPAVTKDVMVGRGFRDLKRLKKMQDRKTRLIYSPDSRLTKRVISGADIAISAGGQTLYELANVGTPAIVISTADNQMNNIIAWRRIGFAEYAGRWHDGKAIERVSEYLERMSSRKVRMEKSRLGRALVDGKGTPRVAREILKASRI